MGKDEETEIGVECADFAIVALATTAESVLDIRFSFDVGRSMFDVRRSSFKTMRPSHLTLTWPKGQGFAFYVRKGGWEEI